MRSQLRVFFALAVAAALFLAVAAGLTALRPLGPAEEVALVRAEAVTDTPLLIERADLEGLSGIARTKRGPPGTNPASVAARGVYVVRDDVGEIRVFVARDPRNGCELEWTEWFGWKFHDVCHGSLYDRNGEPVGGPGPWSLDEAIVTIRGGVVYVSTRDVRLGEFRR